MIKIGVRVFCLPPLLVLSTLSFGQAQSLRDGHQQDVRNVPTGSKGDKEHYEVGRSLEEQGQYEDAVREFQKISGQLTKTLYYNDLGFCLEELRRYDQAIVVFSQVLSLHPKDSYAYRELGICYYRNQQFEKAIEPLEQAISLDPSDAVSHRWLGYAFYRSQKYAAATDALDAALKLEPNDFDANYWHGLSLLRGLRLEEASCSLRKAAELRPSDFNANFWQGISLVRAHKFLEAIPSFEKAREIKPEDKASRIELFTCYLATQQFQKGARLFPSFIAALGGALTVVYIVGFVLLLPFSLPIRAAAFPGLFFSVAWLAVFFVGQGAFFLLFALFPPLAFNESAFSGVMLAALPIIVVAVIGFARQPWGAPYQFPLRFGTWKIAAISFFLLCLLFLIGGAFSKLYVEITGKPLPLQYTIPMVQKALQTNPTIAWLAVALVIPVVEEILFRGLFYGAFEKRWEIKGAILGSAFVFACVHLQLVAFFYLLCIGAILGWARWRCGSLGLPIGLHCLNNATALLALTFLPAT